MIFFVVNSPYTKLHINGVCQKVYISVFKIKEFHLNFIAGPGLRSITHSPHKICASNFAKLSIIDSWFYNYFIIKIYCKFDPCLIKTRCIFVFLLQGNIAYKCFSFQSWIKANNLVPNRGIYLFKMQTPLRKKL